MTAMTFTARNIKDAASAACQCAVLPVFTRKRLSHAAQQLDQASSGAIKAALELGDFCGKSGETLMLPGAGTAKRLLLVGCGDPAKFDRSEAREITQSIYRALNATKAADATIHTADLELKNGDGQWLLAYLARHLTAAAYRYTETVSKPKTPLKLSRVVVNTGGNIATGIAQRALDQGKNTGLGVNEARHLANLPGNICTPTYLAQQARKLGKDNAKLSISILEEKKMKELGMGSLLSVSAGSDEPGGRTTGEYVLLAVGILATIVVTVYITRLARRALAEETTLTGDELPDFINDEDQRAVVGVVRSGRVLASHQCTWKPGAAISSAMASSLAVRPLRPSLATPRPYLDFTRMAFIRHIIGTGRLNFNQLILS